MTHHHGSSDDELPDLRTILRRPQPKLSSTQPLRRSPRKNPVVSFELEASQLVTQVTFSATSQQRKSSPAKNSPSKRMPLNTLQQANTRKTLFNDAPLLPRRVTPAFAVTTVNTQQSVGREKIPARATDADELLDSLSTLEIRDEDSGVEGVILREPPSKTDTLPLQAARATQAKKHVPQPQLKSRMDRSRQRGSRFVLDEARCDEDLVDSDAQDESEDEETDLSGFIVDDDAEISYHEPSDEADSEEERQIARRTHKERPRRRLQRGRRRTEDSEDEVVNDEGLVGTFDKLSLHPEHNEHIPAGNDEVIDLTSPEPKQSDTIRPLTSNLTAYSGMDLFDKFKALKLSPPRSSQVSDVPSKPQSTMWSSPEEDADAAEPQSTDRFTTPPATPPRSPTKLKSPSKLLSPSKRNGATRMSPHRQSMDAFWDLNEVNEWHDQFSPKKAPVLSPRKARLAALDSWSDSESDSLGAINDSSDSLPSPCESPSKSKPRAASPIKAEKQRFLAEKRAKEAARRTFEEERDQMASRLLHALDKNITGSQISKLSASTGGVQIIWSKTLRSTAGRANWRRTVTKASGSPVKGKAEESASGTVIQHFANIELAVKVIDRSDRLINTLAHEFCHLANFMISGVRDQPHGTSFRNWARKVTAWMKSQSDVPEWSAVEVTTKHGYVIEWKYLWLCAGREQNKAIEILNIDEDDGCGAEYGRHSKSIDTEKHRCGRCKGKLIQVRPKPRASPVKKTGRKQPVRDKSVGKGGNFLEKLIEVIELSD